MEQKNYNPFATAQRIAHMAGIGKGVALDPKPFFHMQTALTTSPGVMHFALAGRPDDNAKR